MILNGFPGTLASMWQQAGRAGRTGRRSAAVLVAGDDQLDQWYAAHPRELTRRAPERAVVNPQNPYVLRAQIACAAHELPLRPEDERWFGPGLDDAVLDLVHADLLTPRGGRLYWSGERSPARDVGLRTGSSIEYRLIDADEQRLIGTVDDARVFSVVHPHAVALHRHEPEGTPRNAWRSRVESVELVGDRARVQIQGPVPLVAEVTVAAVDELHLSDGGEVWATVKATEVSVYDA